MRTLTKKDIIQGLNRLGIKAGNHVLVHVAMGSFGKVAGGAETLIDALLEMVGSNGTVMMPAFTDGGKVFDLLESETYLGAAPRAFWKRKNAFRSLHPTVSAAAIGKKAKFFVQGHDNAPTAQGVDSPYGKLAEIGGKILLLGVDQDRSSFLHTAEVEAKLPYLRPVKGTFRNKVGKVKTKAWPYSPGPHRNFIGLQSWFESLGLVKKTRIGSCVAQLMPAKETLEALCSRIKNEPALFISSNPNMPDAIWQKADILREAFMKETFTLAADSLYAGGYIEQIIDNLKRFGIDNIVLSFVNKTAWDKIEDRKRRWYLQGLANADIKIAAIKLQTLDAEKAVALLKESKTKRLIVPSTTCKEKIAQIIKAGFDVYIENLGIGGSDIALLAANTKAKVAFNPLAFAQVGENPFLTTYTKTHIIKHIGALYINDGLATGERAPLEEGLGEIKELISILRCRSFDGLFILQGETSDSFTQTARKFIDMLKELGECPLK